MTRRVAELDTLRAFAASIVLIYHLDAKVFLPGWTGVDLFFVLSGYLITTIVLDHFEAKRFIAVFYARRGLRIWPIYYLSLAVLVATAPLVPTPNRPPLEGLGNYLTFTQNVSLYDMKTPPKFHGGFEHAWTLALEEQFYLIWPALIAIVAWTGWDRVTRFASRRGVRWGFGRRMVKLRRNLSWCLAPGSRNLRLMALCGFLVALAWMARAGGYLRHGQYSDRILIGRCDGFALGGLLAVILTDRQRVAQHLTFYRRAFGVVMLLTFMQMAYSCYASSMIGYFGYPTPPDVAGTILTVNLFYFGLVGAVVTLAGHPWLAPLRWRPLCYMGIISYGIYLYHKMIYWALDGYKYRIEDSFWYGLFKVAVTLAVAIVSWHLVERPILALKDRFHYERADSGRVESREEAPVPALPGSGGVVEDRA